MIRKPWSNIWKVKAQSPHMLRPQQRPAKTAKLRGKACKTDLSIVAPMNFLLSCARPILSGEGFRKWNSSPGQGFRPQMQAYFIAALLYGFMEARHASSLEIGAHDSLCLHECATCITPVT